MEDSDTVAGKYGEQLNSRKLLEIYMYADNILHSRIQSFLLTQTFFVLSYATVLASNFANDDKSIISQLHKIIFLILICFIGAVIASIQREKMLSIHTKIDKLRLTVEKIPEFNEYLRGSVGRSQFGYSGVTPLLIIFLWIALLFIALNGSSAIH